MKSYRGVPPHLPLCDDLAVVGDALAQSLGHARLRKTRQDLEAVVSLDHVVRRLHLRALPQDQQDDLPAVAEHVVALPMAVLRDPEMLHNGHQEKEVEFQQIRFVDALAAYFAL